MWYQLFWNIILPMLAVFFIWFVVRLVMRPRFKLQRESFERQKRLIETLEQTNKLLEENNRYHRQMNDK